MNRALKSCLQEMIEEDMGLSAEGFARKLNVSASTIERWMAGEVDDPFLLLQAWGIAPERFKLLLLPHIGRAIDAWGKSLRRIS